MAIPAELMALYPDLDKLMAPYMRARAARYRGLDIEDAIQEARLALVAAMASYDFNKGDLVPYAREVIANTYRTAVSKNLAGVRCPKVAQRSPEGEWTLAPQLPQSYDALIEARAAVEMESEDSADDGVWNAERAAMMRRFYQQLCQHLDERERRVLKCKLDPPSAVLNMAGDGPVRNIHIAKWLGLDKAQIDWSLYKIRNVFTELAGKGRFHDLFGDTVAARDWPRIHVSKGKRFHNAFVQRTLASRGLVAQPTGEVIDDKCHAGRRRVEYHKWGAILTVWRSGAVWTAVLEGTFNARAGEVSGKWGARLLVPIDGYAQLARSLASEG